MDNRLGDFYMKNRLYFPTSSFLFSFLFLAAALLCTGTLVYAGGGGGSSAADAGFAQMDAFAETGRDIGDRSQNAGPTTCGGRSDGGSDIFSPDSGGAGVGGGGGSGGGGGGSSSGGGGGTSGYTITINEGDPATLTWNCKNSSSSSGVNFSTGGAASGEAQVSPLETTTYTIVCSNGGEGRITVVVLHPILALTANPTRVRSGNASTLTWSAQNVDTCSLAGPGVSASGTSGSQSTGPVTVESTYTLTCQNTAGSKSQNVTVTLAPSFEEI